MSATYQPPIIMAGIPSIQADLFRKIRFNVCDPVAYIELPNNESILILRDIEMDRAKESARAAKIACPADYAPEAGLSGDRETATAQAAAECLRRAGTTQVTAGRALPLIYAEMLRQAGIHVNCDLGLGVTERRQKDQEEIDWLQEAQAKTENVMRSACQCVARATPDANGILQHENAPLTSERLRAMIDIWLIQSGYASPGAIVAGGPDGGDCHNTGTGPLRTGQPVFIDIFPRNNTTRYNGDCTRTVVHGDIPEAITKIHAAIREAKSEAIAATRAGVTGEDVHRATTAALERNGYAMGFPPGKDTFTMPHGTGHGVGLDVHEPPLLDLKGPPLLPGDVVTIEPGLYAKALGGVRLEDMVVVTETGTRNLNQLPETLDWR